MQNNEMNQLMERKYIVAYLKNYPFCASVQKFVSDLLFKFQTVAIFVKNKIKSKSKFYLMRKFKNLFFEL